MATYVGTTIKLKCDSETPVEWTREEDLDVKPSYVQRNNSLIMERVTSSDNGIYFCTGTDNNNKRFKNAVAIRIGGNYFSTEPYSIVHNLIIIVKSLTSYYN